MHEPTIEGVLDLIRDPPAHDFDRVALDVFAFQFERNEPYRRFCEGRHATPGSIARWEDVPPLPTAAFKEADLCCAEPLHVFRTSGTTEGVERRGCHLLPDLDLYRASWPEPFRRALLPDRDRMLTFSLIPPWDEVPESSLSFMAGEALARFGSRGSRSFMDARGLDAAGLANALARSAEEGEPVLLLATTLAADAFLEGLVTPVRLAPGSRIMETGGFKGTTRETSREVLHYFYESLLGVPPSHAVGEYGMTEMCSQLYESTLARALAEPSAPLTHLYLGPPWIRSRVLDPETLAPLPEGKPGLLAHFDLANAWSVASLVTEDLGVAEEGGFRILGRAEGAELRGCSLTAEEFLPR